MKSSVVKSREFFLSRSKLKKHPDLKKIHVKKIDEEILTDEAKRPTKNGNAYKHTKTGYRKDIELNVRSNWEANFVRILKAYKIKFEFEPTVFSFPIKRGVKGYTPDFYLTNTDEWVEMKGYLDNKSKTKIKRFKRYYPKEFEKFTCIISKYAKDAVEFLNQLEVPNIIFYEDIRSEYANDITYWEGK
jgi:hypothetical protein